METHTDNVDKLKETWTYVIGNLLAIRDKCTTSSAITKLSCYAVIRGIELHDFRKDPVGASNGKVAAIYMMDKCGFEPAQIAGYLVGLEDGNEIDKERRKSEREDAEKPFQHLEEQVEKLKDALRKAVKFHDAVYGNVYAAQYEANREFEETVKDIIL